MIIKSVLLLATLLAAIPQGDALQDPYGGCRFSWVALMKPHFVWDHYTVLKDCPLAQELQNPFQNSTQPSSDEICFCTKSGMGYSECPKIETSTNPTGYFSDFLFCWKNDVHDAQDGRYLLSIPSKYVQGNYYGNGYCYYDRKEYYWPTPLLKYRPHVTQYLKDPRCNHKIRKNLRDKQEKKEKERKRLHCKQKSHYTQFMRQRYKKSHR